MRFCKVKLAVVYIILFGLCAAVQAARIPVVSITESSGVTPDATKPWQNLINDSGMLGDTHTLADISSNVPTDNGMSNNYPSIDLTFDLGTDYQLDEIWIWNLNGGTTSWGGWPILGQKYVQVYYQAEGGQDINGGYYQIPKADGTATNAVDLIVDMHGVTARYVKFFAAAHPNLNWTNGVYNSVGLGEVRFYDVNPDPNPDYNVPDLRFENFGYYEADSISFGHYMDKIVIPSDGTKLYDYTNIMHFDINPNYGQADPRQAIKDAANLGYKIFMYTGVFGSYERDHPETWPGLLAQIKAYYVGYEEHIFALQLIDEPDGMGWTRAQVESLVDLARTTFNDGVRLTVNVDNPRGGNVVPRNLDFVLHDYYINYLEMYTRAQYEADMSATLAAIRVQSPDTPIFIIGGCFGGCPDRYNPTPEQQQWYYETAINNPDIIGLMFFMLGNSSSGGEDGLWSGLGVISSPESMILHKQWAQTAVGRTVSIRFEDDFDQYQTQQQLAAVYSGVCPTLDTTKDHGDNGGKSAKFGPGSQNATRRVFANDMPGVAEAFLRDNTITGSGHFGFKAINNAGNYVAVYGGGSSSNYLIRDTANSVNTFNTGISSLWSWQKVSLVFDGSGVEVYVDSELVYSADGWTGGFSSIGGFYELPGNPGWGYIDDIRVSSRTIRVQASSQNDNSPAVNVVNGSGITADRHDSNSANMWLTLDKVNVPMHWIKFSFDKAYPITDMRIWNYNESNLYTKGMKKVSIKYSTDDKNWTAVYLGEIPQANGMNNQEADLTVNFAGTEAKYVAITGSADVNENWSNGLYNETGLSEVYFKFGVPATCFEANIEGYGLGYDMNSDCKVDYMDMGIFADNWLQCLPPGGPGCDSISFEDFAVFALDWFKCIDPENPACGHPWMP